MRRVDGLHHLDDGGAAIRHAEALAGRVDVGRVMADGLEQAQHTVAFLRRADQYRRHGAAAQVGGEIVEDRVLGRLDLLQQLLHQLIVMVGQGLQHGEACLEFACLVVARDLGDLALGVFAVDVGALQREIDRADDDAVLAQRYLAQQQWHGAGRLQHLQRVAHARYRLVDLVEEKDARHAEIVELAHDELQRGDLLLIGLGDHDGDIAGGQDRLGLEGEFDRAGAIDESELLAHEIRSGNVRLDAHGVGARLRRMV